jgi:hypothetical protein
MAIFGVSIEKEVPYRGGTEIFSNVYHYFTETLEAFDDTSVVQELVSAESGVFAAEVGFLVARTWGPVDQGPIASVMRTEQPLTGTGTLSNVAEMTPERAVMLRWPTDTVSITGQPVYLRKWIHAPGGGTTGEWSSGIMGETQVLSQSIVDRFLAYADTVSIPTGRFASEYELCSPTGRRQNGVASIFAYLEHRNFH